MVSRRKGFRMTTTPDENTAVETRLAVLEANTAAVQEGQRQLIARLDSMEQANDARFDSLNARFDALNSRIDRIFYTILALGIGAIGTLIALDKIL